MLNSKKFTLRWVVAADDAGSLVRDFLYKKEISKTALVQIKYHGGLISVNDEEVTVRYALEAGDLVIVQFPEEVRSASLQAENIPLAIVYEDDAILVIDKRAQMNTIPSREHPTGSVTSALMHLYDERGICATAHIVTRLDRDTSGLLLIAKHRHIHHLLSKQQKSGTITRKYKAVVHGRLEREVGVIEQPISRKSTSIIEREVNAQGQYACTHYAVIFYRSEFSYVEIKLITGRTHQIRVHFSYLGHPLLGDTLYGGERTLISRQALHCCELSFTHPITKKQVSFQADPPLDMKSLFTRS